MRLPLSGADLETRMKLVALLLVAWLAGLLSYLASLRVFYAERISPRDLGAVVL